MRRIILSALAVWAFSSPASAQQKYVGWATGYLAGWAQGYPPSKILWKNYTHMCHFSATPSASGDCKLAMGLNASMANAFTAEAHKNGVKAVLCIGGAGTGSGFKGAASPANRAKFIASMINLIKTYNYDGLDVDWEEGTGGADYIALHQELRAELDKITPRPVMTAAVGSYYSKDLAKVAPYCDQLNNMCYWTKAANLNGTMTTLVNMGIAKSKLGVGIGLDYLESGNPEVDCDPESARAKCQYAVDNAYGGIMVWEVQMDAKKFGDSQPVHAAMLPFVNKSVGIALRGDRALLLSGNRLTGVPEVFLANGAKAPLGRSAALARLVFFPGQEVSGRGAK